MKNIITYYKTYGRIVLQKHVDANHFIIVIFFEIEINDEAIRTIEKQQPKKGQMFQQVQYLFLLLWMSKGAHDIFALVIKKLGCDWQPKQVTIGLFNAT
jgi:hypothetical protein